ncbi:MAG TPA: ABC transporter transmembrane domain-containing protein [Cyclobacteriaceae bacterium]|nr:ABC transporter transmembrane domain-containing protein [Cyclobacteriaceae bacterium]
MAKRNKETITDQEKRKVNKKNLRKVLGIFRFAARYKWIFISGLVALSLSSVTLLSFPYFAGKLLDIASGKTIPFLSSINEAALILVLILFIQGIFSFVRVYTFSIVSERTLADVRRTLYEKIIWSPMSFFDNNRVGDLMSRLTADVSTLQETFTTSLAELLRQVITLLFGTALIFYLTPKLSAFMFLTVPFIVLIAMLFGKFIRNLSRKTQDKLAEANVVAEESLHSIAVVKAFTNEVFEVMRYAKSLNETVRVAIRSSRYRGLFISFIIFAIFGAIISITRYGAKLVQSGDLTVGELLAFILYTTFIGGSMAGLGDIYTQLQRAIGASERMQEILECEDESVDTDAVAIKLQGEIDFDHIHFTYPTRTEVEVLKNLNLQIKAGEKIALVGPSGSGKSTIINLLLRFYPVDRGSITVDNVDINTFNLSAYRHNFGIVPQEVILFGGTIEENIAYGKPNASSTEIQDAAEKANAMEFISKFPEQLQTKVGERGVKLSGGQRQRIAIARAILKNPAVLILDEATSSLDSKSETLVQEALEKLMEGRTTIIIAHRLSTIRKVDRIFVIKEGQVAETGSHHELSSLHNGIYNDLLKLQLE